LDDRRHLYDAALEERRQAYRRCGVTVRYGDQSGQLRDMGVDPRNTSRTCPACGHRVRENRVTLAEFRCVSCGHCAHADVNAARNILRAGLARQTAVAV
jgi:transposase